MRDLSIEKIRHRRGRIMIRPYRMPVGTDHDPSLEKVFANQALTPQSGLSCKIEYEKLTVDTK